MQDVKVKLKAILWKRQSIEEGGLFVKYFAVLEKGRLDFYYKEKDYRENANPVNPKSIKLWQYDLELDPRYVRMVCTTFVMFILCFAGNMPRMQYPWLG